MKGGIKKLAVGRKDLFLLDPKDIQEDEGWNVREENNNLTDHIRELANSIKEIGVQQPLTVYIKDGVPIVTDGHCRLLAARLAIGEGAEIKSIPVRTEERFCNDADRVLSMLTRNSGKSLSIPEQAEVIKRLLVFNWSEFEISKKTGLSPKIINNLVKFISAPTEVQEMVKKGEVSATTAVNQIRKEGPKAVKTLRTAVETAKKSGKKKATSKHIRKEKDLIRPIENFAGQLPVDHVGRAGKILELCKELRELIGPEPDTEDKRQMDLPGGGKA